MAVKQISGADRTTKTLEPPETGERATDEMIAIIETRRQQAIKSNDRNKRPPDDSGALTTRRMKKLGRVKKCRQTMDVTYNRR